MAKLFQKILPERQLMVRTDGQILYVRVSRWTQMAGVGVLAAAVGWAVFATVDFARHQDVLAGKDREVAEARGAYRSLLAEVTTYQKKFSSITRDLEENHSVMLELVEQNAALQQNLQTMESQLKTSEGERQRVVSVREQLKGELRNVQVEMQALATRNYALKDNLNSTETSLQQVVAERNLALSDGRRMKTRISELESALHDLNRDQEDTVDRLTEATQDNIEEVEKLIGTAGLDANSLLEAADYRVGQGGPFVAADTKEDDPSNNLKVKLAGLDQRLDRWDGLRDVLGRLPLTLPVNNSYVTSRFGKRRDPFNKKWAMHYGVDFGGPKNSSIYVTAPGKVTFAGYKNRYGRVVEISHGAGLKTIYGHLKKIVVKKGDRVTHRQKIAVMGNSGRSTGTHLHYEIRFNGRPYNPLNFIKAGRNVFQG